MKLALADAHGHIADAPLPAFLLDPAHLAGRRALIRPDRALDAEPSREGATTYLCCVDGDRNAISLIQSTYEHFGSGVLAGDTGVVLQNRGACFSSEPGHPNGLAPGKRPFHTIIPGMLLEGGRLLGPFGVMGGAMQAQGHFQVVRNLVDGDDPQARARRRPLPRRRRGARSRSSRGSGPRPRRCARSGHEPVLATDPHGFGVGQAILRSATRSSPARTGAATGTPRGSSPCPVPDPRHAERGMTEHRRPGVEAAPRLEN